MSFETDLDKILNWWEPLTVKSSWELQLLRCSPKRLTLIIVFNFRFSSDEVTGEPVSNTIFSFKTSFAEFNISLNCGAAKVKRGAGDSFAFITTIVQQKEP